MEIVGLKNFVQDDINKLIFKFVGFKHPVAEMFFFFFFKIWMTILGRYVILNTQQKTQHTFFSMEKKGGLFTQFSKHTGN